MSESIASELRAQGFALIETHISRVFLRGEHVYKTKRAVALGFLDFSTLALREAACRAELTLNARLAPGVYLDVVALVREGERLSFRAPAEVAPAQILEWAVHMRRLADDVRADVSLARGELTRADLERVAALLADFHEHARSDAVTAAFGEPRQISENVEENFTQTAATIGEYLTREERDQLLAYQRGFLRDQAALLERRVRAGFVRDGHGDLRLEHLYREPDGRYVAIDCIEFNERFRYADVCADIAFLTMDLRHAGRADLAELLLSAYARERADYELYGLLDFYESYRAFVRAKVTSLVAHDRELDDGARERAQGEARRYYLLALSAARRPVVAARLIVAFGGIASGKSTLADALGAQLAVPVLSSDYTRKQLLGVEPTAPQPEQAFQGAYSSATSERVYAALFARAEPVLRSGRSVILDATFRTRAERARAAQLAERLGVELLFCECVCPRELALERLRRRSEEPSVSDGRAEIYDAFAASFEPASELADDRHLRLDTRAPLASTLSLALEQLGFLGLPRLK